MQNERRERAVKFNDVVGAGSRVKTVDVLCDDDHTTTLLFQSRLTLGYCHVTLQLHTHHHH